MVIRSVISNLPHLSFKKLQTASDAPGAECFRDGSGSIARWQGFPIGDLRVAFRVDVGCTVLGLCNVDQLDQQPQT